MGDFITTEGLSRSRQKNCNNCVQAKRRCDRKTPLCSRCTEKKADCVYGKTKHPIQPHKEDFAPSPTTPGSVSFGSLAYSPFDLGWFADTNCLDVTAEQLQEVDVSANITAPAQDYMMDIASTDDLSIDTSITKMSPVGVPVQEQWLVQTDRASLTTHRDRLAKEEVKRAYTQMYGLCHDMGSWISHDPTTSLHYILNRVKGFTSDIATRNAAPFLHGFLYRDCTPPCVLSCFTTSVLYTSRTRENTAMVMRALHGNVKEFIDAEVNRTVSTPLETLARTQALFLYQIIRLLDGDISLRAQGEKDIPLLLKWLGELCRLRENLDDSNYLENNAMRKSSPPAWETWILAESVRRTIIIAHSFISLYELMKNPDHDATATWSQPHRWTLSRHLWEADSTSRFTGAWKENPHFVIANYSFEHFLECGRGEDVDGFAEIMLSAYLGVDGMRDFVST